ncbi:MAG: hypothetical protein RIR97_1348 [Pseudomonadota bacterium]|jgi:hypothetical protein
MANYYRNKNAQSNGDHEVHRENCSWLPTIQNRQLLGDFLSCQPAVQKAKLFDQHADGCAYCSPSCHTR